MMPPAPQVSVSSSRQLLRDGTHAAHVRLNQHPLLHGLVKPGYPRSCYLLLLVAYYHFYKAIEARIDQYSQAAGLAFSYEGRHKLPWLEKDLRHFGIDPEFASHLPGAELVVREVASLGEMVGLLYTIEGSTLGGQVIAKYLDQFLGLRADNGARFFSGYGDDTMCRWLELEAFMDASLVDEQAQMQAIERARETFLLIETVLDGYLARQLS
jgi:heme oxygenase (biliverdin-IX-beta and delta-forming)